MSENKLYRVDGKLYRREPAKNWGCKGCAFDGPSLECGHDGFPCFDGQRATLAKRILATLPVPASVEIVDL